MGATKIFGTGRNVELLEDVKALAPDRIEVHAVGDGSLNDFVREHNGGEGVDVVISTLGPGSPKETLLEALSTLARGGVLVDIGGMMEHPELDLFHMMCSQNSVIGSLWFTNGEAQEMSDLAGSGALDLSVLEHHVFPLEKINEALDDGLPARHGGFSNFIITPDQALLVLTCGWTSALDPRWSRVGLSGLVLRQGCCAARGAGSGPVGDDARRAGGSARGGGRSFLTLDGPWHSPVVTGVASGLTIWVTSSTDPR